MILQLSLIEPQRDFEIVEKKCVGHPDTLADGLAEYLSQQYALYTKEKFGVILHHNFDKVGLLGGASYVKFGEGFLTSPIRVLLNGRASTKFADCNIPVNELLTNWAREFLKEKLPLLDVEKDIVFLYNLSNQSSPGKTEEKQRVAGTRKFWFEPRGIFDLQEQQKLFSNDTSLGVGYYPYSTLEKIVDAIAYKLTEYDFKHKNPWIGTDIKIMGHRNKDIVNITLCVPQISRYVYSDIMYKNNLKLAHKIVESTIKEYGISEFKIDINTRDDFDKSELYLTAIGSSIESGDEGLVGRGNRINGLIAPMRPMSMEGAAGKNPVYHIGKVYHVTANLMSKKIFEELGIPNEVFLVSQSGRDLFDPWIVHVNVTKDVNENVIRKIVEDSLKEIPNITEGILNNLYTIY